MRCKYKRAELRLMSMRPGSFGWAVTCLAGKALPLVLFVIAGFLTASAIAGVVT